MVELKTYDVYHATEERIIEVSDSEYEFLLSLLKVTNQQELLRSKYYIFDGRESLHITINNIYVPPVVKKT